MGIQVEPAVNTNKSLIHIQEVADLLRAVDENALVAITNPSGLITHVNKLFCQVSKYSEEELIGQNHRVLNSGCHDASFWRDFWETIVSGRVWKGEIKNCAKDGSFFWVEATIAPTFDDLGRLKQFLAVYLEISPQKKAEERLRLAQRQDSLRVMAGGIAHDFNNLLTSILGNCGILGLTTPEGSPSHPFLKNIEQAVHRAALLTNQLLAFTGRGPWMPIQLELNTFLRGMENALALSLPKALHFKLEMAPEPLPVNADPSQLHQIIVSLVNNATEAIGEGRDGAIFLRLRETLLDEAMAAGFLPQTMVKPGAYAVLQVVDSGCGMTPEILARIFEPFFSTKFTGRGLGLSAVIGILRAWGGGITVASAPGRGSTFEVFLPLVMEEIEGKPLDQPPSLTFPGGAILFVDDEPMLRECGAEFLEASGYEVVQAADGLAALELFQARGCEFEVVVMDLTMPRLGGIEAARKMRELRPATRIILSSGYSDDLFADCLGPLKPNAFLHKPYTLEGLRESIQRVASGLS